MEAQSPIDVIIGFFAKLHDGLAWVFSSPARAAVILTPPIAVLVILWVAVGGGIDVDDEATNSTRVNTVSASAIVNNDLLGDGNYIGSGTFSVVRARKAYNADAGATAVAAKVSVPGDDELCLFWYVGGRDSGDGLIVGDTLTRAFSIWGSEANAGSPADEMVNDLKETSEGEAVIAATGC